MKYFPENLIPMFHKAASLRNEMIDSGFTDNGGAIHSAERILDILGQRINYPGLTHINNLRNYPGAEFSFAALEAHELGEKVLIEHVSPHRDFTRGAIAELSKGISDDEFMGYVKRHYRLVLLTAEETKRLNKINRSLMIANRLSQADIEVVVKFQNNEDVYSAWLSQNADGFVFNFLGGTDGYGYMNIVHRASCRHLHRPKDEGRRTVYEKRVSKNLDSLIAHVEQLRGDSWKLCGAYSP